MGRWPTWRQKLATFNRLSYVPHSAQIPIHQCDARVVVVVGAERAGKSLFAGNEVTARAPWCERVGFTGQDYVKARAEWKYTVDALTSLGAISYTSMPHQGQWVAQARTNCELKTISLERGVDQLTGTGEPYDIIVLCEWGLMNYNAFLAARGRVVDKHGMVLAIGTLGDSIGWQADLWRLGQAPNALGVESFSLPAWASSISRWLGPPLRTNSSAVWSR